MRTIILFFSIVFGIISFIFAQFSNFDDISQSAGIVLASYSDTAYMNSLNGNKAALPSSFLQEIEDFNILSYEQAFPYSKNTFLKSAIIFYCKDHPLTFATYLKENAAHLFSHVEYELPVEWKLDYDPSDYFWNKKKYYPLPAPNDSIDYLWHLKKIEADKAWDITKGNPNIKIAVLDMGFDAGGFFFHHLQILVIPI